MGKPIKRKRKITLEEMHQNLQKKALQQPHSQQASTLVGTTSIENSKPLSNKPRRRRQRPPPRLPLRHRGRPTKPLVAPHSPTTQKGPVRSPPTQEAVHLAKETATVDIASQQNCSPPGKRRVPLVEKRPVQPSSKPPPIFPPTAVALHSNTEKEEEPHVSAASLNPRARHQTHDSLRPRVEPTKQTAKTPPEEPAQTAPLESRRSSMELTQTVDKIPNVGLAQTEATSHQFPLRGIPIFRRARATQQQESVTVAQTEATTHQSPRRGISMFMRPTRASAPTEETDDTFSLCSGDFCDHDPFSSPVEPAQTNETHDSRPSRGGIAMFRSSDTQTGTKTMALPIPTQAGTSAMLSTKGKTSTVVPTQACSNAMVPTREASNAVVPNPTLSNMTRMQPNNNAMTIDTVPTQMNTSTNAILAVGAHAQNTVAAIPPQASNVHVMNAILAVTTHAQNAILALATQTTNPNDNAINAILAVTTEAHGTILALTTQGTNVMAQASKGTNDEKPE